MTQAQMDAINAAQTKFFAATTTANEMQAAVEAMNNQVNQDKIDRSNAAIQAQNLNQAAQDKLTNDTNTLNGLIGQAQAAHAAAQQAAIDYQNAITASFQTTATEATGIGGVPPVTTR